ARAPRPHLRRLLHDETAGDGHRPCHLPVDRHRAWRRGVRVQSNGRGRAVPGRTTARAVIDVIGILGLLSGLGIGVATRLLVERRRSGSAGAADPLHPDDRIAIAQAEARAFCSGVPQVVRYRRRDRKSGEWRWHEHRAASAYPVTVAVPPLVHAPGEAWTVAA